MVLPHFLSSPNTCQKIAEMISTLISGSRRCNSRGSSEKWQQTGQEVAQRHLPYDDPQNIQDGAEGSGRGGGK